MNDYVNDFNEAVKSYYESLKKCTPISREEEKKLLTLAKQGDISAKNKIIESNLRFVFNIAKKYKGYGVPINELISEGNIGLLKAIEKFDDTKDVKFISYAVWWVKHMIFTFVKTKGYGKSVSTISDESLKSKIENIEIEDEEERQMFIDELGITEPSLNRLIRGGFKLLGLITYFTAGEKEVRAWTIKQGTNAQKSAGEIHTDIEKGFIRAEVVAYEKFIEYNGWQGAKEKGAMRLEGKEYVVNDGDVMYFRFNV